MRGFLGINLQEYEEDLKKIDLKEINNKNKAKEYHITLIFFKEISEQEIENLRTQVNRKFKRFSLKADSVYSFPENKNPELYGLCFRDISKLNKIRDVIMRLLNIKVEDRFTPHITLLRNEKLSSHFKDSKEKYKSIKPLTLEIKSIGFYKSEPEKGMNSYSPVFVINLI